MTSVVKYLIFLFFSFTLFLSSNHTYHLLRQHAIEIFQMTSMKSDRRVLARIKLRIKQMQTSNKICMSVGNYLLFLFFSN